MGVKKKAIHAELRKSSNAFDGWLKYEVTIEHDNGELERVPAYGKDLQDALSRVVHDEKVEKLERKFLSKIPLTGWVLAWFLGLTIMTMSLLESSITEDYKGFFLVGSMVLYMIATLSITNWFQLKNVKK
jgi:hypothetical protein